MRYSRCVQLLIYSYTDTESDMRSQLRGLVESGVSQVELRQILSQLRTMAPPPPPPQVVPPPQQFQAPPPPPTLPHSYGTLPPPATHFNFPASTQNAQFRPPSTSLTHTSPPPNLTSVLGDTAKLQGLFSALIKAGVVPDSKSGTPLGAGSSSRTDVLPSSETNHARDVARAYRHTVLSHKIKLTSADITRYVFDGLRSYSKLTYSFRQKPVITKLMYERLPAQCKQCGIRFPDGDAGKKDMDDHLDMHFRQNRKASQNAGRGHNRSWFISIEVSLSMLARRPDTNALVSEGLAARRFLGCQGQGARRRRAAAYCQGGGGGGRGEARR